MTDGFEPELVAGRIEDRCSATPTDRIDEIYVVNRDGTGRVALTVERDRRRGPRSGRRTAPRSLFASTPSTPAVPPGCSADERGRIRSSADSAGHDLITGSQLALDPDQRLPAPQGRDADVHLARAGLRERAARPNRTHAAPLSYGSCKPPQQSIRPTLDGRHPGRQRRRRQLDRLRAAATCHDNDVAPRRPTRPT